MILQLCWMKGKQTVKREDILLSVYDAIFVNAYDYRSEFDIGNCRFDNLSKGFAIRYAGLAGSNDDLVGRH